jgi:excisionase family DNA binding protein
VVAGSFIEKHHAVVERTCEGKIMFEQQIEEMNKKTDISERENKRDVKDREDSMKDSSEDGKRTYRIEEIQDILDISRSAAYSLIKRKEFHSVKIGGLIRVSRKSFDRWLDQAM